MSSRPNIDTLSYDKQLTSEDLEKDFHTYGHVHPLFYAFLDLRLLPVTIAIVKMCIRPGRGSPLVHLFDSRSVWHLSLNL